MPLHFIKVGQYFGKSLLNIKCTISSDLGYCVPCDVDVRGWFCSVNYLSPQPITLKT